MEGLPAIQYQEQVMNHIAINTAVKRDKYIYVIGTVTVGNDDLTEIYKSMLSTFRFL